MRLFFSTSQLLARYRNLICPWFSCLTKAFRLINSPPLTDCLDSLSHRRNVGSLSLYYRYFHSDCSSELVNCMPPPLPRPRCTILSTSSYPCSVHLSNPRVNQYLHSFIPYSDKLWNSLSLSVFPPAYDSFKRWVSRHLSYYIGRPIPSSISLTVLTRSDDKRDFFKRIFVYLWPVSFIGNSKYKK